MTNLKCTGTVSFDFLKEIVGSASFSVQKCVCRILGPMLKSDTKL